MTSTPYCLSVRQPWAWLLANRWENGENRTRSTRIRGPTYIHASGTMTQADYDACILFIGGFSWGPDLLQKMPPPRMFDLGGIVGQVNILDCVRRHSSDWFCGPWFYVVDQAKPLPFHRCPGHQGWFTPPQGFNAGAQTSSEAR